MRGAAPRRHVAAEGGASPAEVAGRPITFYTKIWNSNVVDFNYRAGI